MESLGSEVLLAILSVATTALWWMLRRDRKGIDEKFTKIESDLDSIRDDVSSFREGENQRVEKIHAAITSLETKVITAIGELRASRAELFVTKIDHAADIRELREAMQKIKDHCFEMHSR